MERTLETTRRRRPERAEAEPAVLELVRRHGGRLMSVARRYSSCREDAEDAYQRAVEILLTRAPSADAAELLPWMKTVVKHEAFAVGRQRARHGTPSAVEQIEPFAGLATGPAELAERRDRLRLGAEALGRLKPHEVRALLLRAEGLSYREICAATGWSYTKVNRCLSEGRRSFLDRVAGIEGGDECERLRPLLSTLADGEATGADVAALRPHLGGCLACRARLREYRRAPSSVAAAVVPVGLVAALWDALRGAAHSAMTHKAAAVAASGAVLAGGGVATVHVIEGAAAPPAPPARVHRVPPRAPAPPPAQISVRAVPPRHAARAALRFPRPGLHRARKRRHRPALSPSVPLQGEFAPTAAVKGVGSPRSAAPSPIRPAHPGGGAGRRGEGGEFAP